MQPKFLGKLAIVAAILVIAAMLLPACQTTEPTTTTSQPPTTTTSQPPTTTQQPAIKNPDTFIYATIGGPDSMDPAYSYDTASGEAIQLVYENLIFYDKESTTEFIPVLATEWNVSADGKTYRFKIREGVTFHNGNSLTPEDVEYTFERGMVQDYGAGPQWMFFEPLFGPDTHSSRDADGNLMDLADISSKVEVDGQWVQFNLVGPYPPFLQILSGSWGCIVDKEWCIANGDWDGTQASYEALNDPEPGSSPLQEIMNGTGPFKLERWEPGVEASYVKNANYWGGTPNFERVVIKVIDEWTTRKLMLESGDADFVDVPRANINEIIGQPNIREYKDLPTLQVDGIFFQFDISPDSTFVGSGQLDGNGIPLDFFSDVNVRKGFAYAFDYETFLADAMMGEATQPSSPIPDGLAYINPDQPKYYLDLDKAEEYLKAAWNGQVWEKGFTFTIGYNAGNLARKTACEILQNNLFQINPNFKVNIQVMQWSTLLRSMYMQLVPMFQIGWLPDFPDAHNFIFPFMSSSGTFSAWQSYSDPEVDQLIKDGITSTDDAERQAAYYALQQKYYDDVPSIAIQQPLGRRFFRDWVKGFYYNVILPSNAGWIPALSKGY